MSSTNADGTPLEAADRQELIRRIRTARLWWSRAVSLMAGTFIPEPKLSDEPELLVEIRKMIAHNKAMAGAIRAFLEAGDNDADYFAKIAALRKLVT